MGWNLGGRGGEILTVGQVAAMLGVAARTVTRLADDGELRCWTVPKSTHRRFARADVVAFCERHGIPASVYAGGEG